MNDAANMHIINSKTDISTYVANYGGQLTNDEHDALVDAIQDADHPAYGSDWSEWLDANWEALNAAADI